MQVFIHIPDFGVFSENQRSTTELTPDIQKDASLL